VLHLGFVLHFESIHPVLLVQIEEVNPHTPHQGLAHEALVLDLHEHGWGQLVQATVVPEDAGLALLLEVEHTLPLRVEALLDHLSLLHVAVEEHVELGVREPVGVHGGQVVALEHEHA